MNKTSLLYIFPALLIGCVGNTTALRRDVNNLKLQVSTLEKAQNTSTSQEGSVHTTENIDQLRTELDELKESQVAMLAVLAKQKELQPTPYRRPIRPRPNPESVYAIDLKDSPSIGPKNAKVTIVEAFEFAWPFCQKVGPTIEQLLKDYKGQLKVVYKNYIVHPDRATEPALAACAAQLQGKYTLMKDYIWNEAFSKQDFSRTKIEELARKSKLRMKKFRSDRDSVCVNIIENDKNELLSLGVTGTPAFFINGRFLSGAQPIDRFRELIDEELKKANERIRSGKATKANYYKNFVLNKGLRKLAP